MAERGTGSKIMSFTAKRARRVQEKMMQKLGKSDQTKDEVFGDFVTNFNRQSATAHKLQKELTRYMNALRMLNQCTRSLGECLKELYEPGWAGHDKYGSTLETRMLLWENHLSSLQSKLIEPMSNYISKFPEVKARIQKRERKVVDYDLRRRELEALKTKQKVTDQKLQQGEESYSQAKQLFDEITDELYEELPTFFDSRIQFYASIFQSLASNEAFFHSEVTKVDEDLAGIMDSLANEAATAIHTTKKERTLDSTPKLMSRPGEHEDSDSDSEIPPSPLAVPMTTTPENTSQHEDSNSTTSNTPTHNAMEAKPEAPSAAGVSNDAGSRRQPPSKPTRDSMTEQTSSDPASAEQDTPPQQSVEGGGATPTQEVEPPGTNAADSPTNSKPALTHELSDADLAELDSVIERTSPVKSPVAATSIPPPKPSSPPPKPTSPLEKSPDAKPVPEPGNMLYKVIATHPYQGEDEDELSFEKGATIAVVPYDDPEDEEEGWSTGILLSNGDKGIFPNNFTKKLDQ